MKLNDNIKYIKGVGEARAKLFNRLGIFTVRDLLYHLPRTFEDRSQIKSISELIDGETVCVCGTPSREIKTYRTKGRLSVTQTTISDGTDSMHIVWFNSPYIVSTLSGATEFTFYGKVTYKGNKFEMVNPVVEVSSGINKKTGKIIPIYPSTSGLMQHYIRTTIENAFFNLEDEIPDVFPQSILAEYDLLPIMSALKKIHTPSSFEEFENARRRLAFEEFFIMQAGILSVRDERLKYSAHPIKNVKCAADFVSALPFSLTSAQKRVINEVCADLKKPIPMNRLIQGDVGSGKTIVAASAMFTVVKSGFQAALMAPTEILAVQHFKNLSVLFKSFGITTVLLTGGMPAAEKRKNLEMIKSGDADIIIGTHALLTDNVSFSSLALVITDEQHRFGVRQRITLTSKGTNAHTLVMTATPIPRTLSLILYGDLDISVIDELPPGRKPIETYAVSEKMRNRIYSFISKNVDEGRQIYIVCPLIEESEALSAKSATEYAEKLKTNVFPRLNIAVMHGKLKAKEKNDIMRLFSEGEIDILVSTTVIEVGVDVPNATVMVIENAERFGLSQLHQLRGRIGRGSYQSYCIMFCNSGKIAAQRMQVMCETNDGFKISEKDLELRGPGEFFGVRQHGLPELRVANLSSDMNLLITARDAVQKLLNEDPHLQKIENSVLKSRILSHFEAVGENGVLN